MNDLALTSATSATRMSADATTANSKSSATAAAQSDAAIPLTMRQDLVVVPLQFGDSTYWSIKDPIRLQYFQLRDEEYFVLKSLDGKRGLQSLQRGFHSQFAPLRLDEQQLHAFLAKLHGQGLLVGDMPGQTGPLLAKRQRQDRRKRLTAVTGVLAIRFRGIDPDRFLDRLYPYIRWLFSPWVMIAAMLCVVSALALLVAEWETLIARLPGFYSFFNVDNLIWLGVAVGAAKVLHELGHALTCKHLGGECHEMGIMLLVFTPCMYCNVSDAWMMRNKWRRIAVSGAGILVEIVLASLCTILWWFSEPGLLNSVCLNVMFVCSVSTLLFNGNPLLRYDGYYILSDLVEIPNLRQQATIAWQQVAARWWLGMNTSSTRMLAAGRRGFLIGYALAANAYRLLAVFGILWFLYSVLKPYGLQILAQAMGAMMGFGLVVTPTWKLIVFLTQAVREQKVNRSRAGLVLLSMALLLAGVLLVPLPSRVYAPLVIEPAGATRVFVAMTGRLPPSHDLDTPIARIGDEVRSGQPLATLRNENLLGEIEQLEGKAALLRKRVQALRTISIRSDEASDRLPTTEESLRNIEQQLAEKREQKNQLRITAPLSGIILPAEEHHDELLPGELETWSGAALDPLNAGSTLEAGTTLCLIGDPRSLQAILVVDQSHIEFVRIGQRVRIWAPQSPGRLLTGKITEVADSRLEVAPVELAEAGKIAVVMEDGAPRPASASFQARVALDSIDQEVALRSTGMAAIEVAPSSLGWRFYRYLRSTFRFKL